MSSLRRGLLSRFSNRDSNSRSRDLPPPVDRFDLRINGDDSASIRTVLPAYSRNSSIDPNRPPSPAPTYYTVDERQSTIRSSSTTPTSTSPTPNGKPAGPVEQSAIDELVKRLRQSLNNPKSWRLNHDGRKSFFWALRCAPGTADLLHDNIDEIKARVFEKCHWQVEKFCFIFKGQKLVDLWCRPIDTQVVYLKIY
jgi:hypothetical protein